LTRVREFTGKQQQAAFNDLDPKSIQAELTNPKPNMHKAGDPTDIFETNIFHKNFL